MSDKYLFLEFENAGWFQNNIGSCDKIFNRDCYDNKQKYKDRENVGVITEPITVGHVSNMLHVLFGERPIPMHRDSFAKPIDKFIDMANNSFLKISSYKKEQYPREKIRLKKAVWDAHSKGIRMNWYIIKEYIGQELFQEFLSILESKYGITSEKYTLVDALKVVRSDISHILYFNEKLEKNKKTAFSQFIKDENNCTIPQNDNPRVKHTYANSIDDISRISGFIIVPVDDYDLLKLKNCVGTATILDGGLVSIKRLCYDYNAPDISDYRKVSEISVEINEKSYKH